MAAANGTPIRLVQDSGNLIELNATNIAFTVDRGVTPFSLPAAGGRRFSIDLNKNKSLIVVEGVFTDDTQGSGARNASALIDFSVSQTGANTGDFNHVFVTNDNIDNLLISTTSARMTIVDSAGTQFNLFFEETAGTPGYNTATDKLRIKSTDGTRITAVQFTQGVADWINTDVPTISAVVVNSLINQNSLGLNSALRVTHDVIGAIGNTALVGFGFGGSVNYLSKPRKPHIEVFSGGRDAIAKSAGDKVMDLYGIMNNSSRNIPEVTIGGGVVAVGGAVGAFFTGGLSLALTVAGGGLAINSLYGDDDYILGIQIPYNSKIQAGGDTYVARNFFMPTGLKKTSDDKGSEANTLPASTTFDTGDEYTGIQGTVTKMDIFYDAGATVYGFRMDFSPIDNMI
jgi:hypothetical protein